MARATIVIVGMGLAIPLFWLDHPGWGAATGFVALAFFWLSVPSELPAPDPAIADEKANDGVNK
jgi:hypothetical protein